MLAHNNSTTEIESTRVMEKTQVKEETWPKNCLEMTKEGFFH